MKNQYIKNHWKNTLIILLILTAVGLFFYYQILPSYNQNIAQIGYNQAIAQVFQLASQCQQVPITFDNQTINMIAVECLQNSQG